MATLCVKCINVRLIRNMSDWKRKQESQNLEPGNSHVTDGLLWKCVYEETHGLGIPDSAETLLHST